MASKTSQLQPVIARAIVLSEESVAINRRNNNGHEYLAFPGGHIEGSETPQKAAERELREEMSLEITAEYLGYIYVSKKWGIQYYFIVRLPVQQPLRVASTSEEFVDNQRGKNTYKPEWIAVEQLVSEPVLPKLVLDAFLADYAENTWSNEPKILIEEEETV